MTCWWCYWGWPQQIHDIFREAAEKLGEGGDDILESGPSHIVWGDENWHLAQLCLDYFNDPPMYPMSAEEAAIVRESLERLLLVDERYKQEPYNYDGENPSLYPPPAGWVMVRQ